MTLCPSGSSVNPSAPPFSWVTWLEAQSWLGVLMQKFSWLAYLIQPVLVDVPAFCAVEPPQPVYPGDATVAAASHDPVAFETILTYLRQSATWFAWSHLCQCNASGTPGCIASFYSHASNLGLHYDWAGSALAFRIVMATGGLTLWGLDIDVITPGSYQIIWFDVPTTIDNFTTVTLAAGWNRVYFSAPLSLSVTSTYEFAIRRSISGNTMDTYYQVAAPATPAGMASFQPRILPWNLSTDNPVVLVNYGIDPVICASSPVGYSPPPPPLPVTTIPDVPTDSCTTIGDLCRLLQPTILDLSLVTSRLDLLQRRLLPFAWIVGTSYPGLTGSGSIAVRDILGLLVSFTTIPSGWGQTADTPGRRIPALGMIQADDGTVYDDARQLHYPSQIVMLEAPWATAVRYNLRAGTVATITLILPEP